MDLSYLANRLVIVPSSGTAHNQPDPEDGVYALDFKTGRRAWHAHFDQDANGIAATKTHVFATSDDGHVYALDVKTGRVVWKHKGKGKMYSHPLLVDGKVIVGDAMGNLRALNARDGSPVWSKGFVGAIRGGAAADASAIYVTSQGGDAAKLSFSGKVLWKKRLTRPPWGGRGKPEALEIYSPPVLVGGLMNHPFRAGHLLQGRACSDGARRPHGPRAVALQGAGPVGQPTHLPGQRCGRAGLRRTLFRRHRGHRLDYRPHAVAQEGGVPASFLVGRRPRRPEKSPTSLVSTVHCTRFARLAANSSGRCTWVTTSSPENRDLHFRSLATDASGRCLLETRSFHPSLSPTTGTVLVGSGEGFLYALGD